MTTLYLTIFACTLLLNMTTPFTFHISNNAVAFGRCLQVFIYTYMRISLSEFGLLFGIAWFMPTSVGEKLLFIHQSFLVSSY